MDLFNSLPDSQTSLAVFILVATFVYEDGATLLAATLSSSGRLNPWFALITTFLGIWIGDLGLYVLGSSLGRHLAWSRVAQKYFSPESLHRAEAWFARHGSFALVMSRAIPGSRLPLYTAAGALRLSLGLFARTTAVCSAVWVGAIFAIWRFTPSLSPGHEREASLILIMLVLIAPWLAVRTVRFVRRSRKAKMQHSAVDACAL
jgi:membrane protein DedA with SNARE-associated domain